jgi:YfiH family protein
MADGFEPKTGSAPFFLTARSLTHDAVSHGFFSRIGGVSEGLYASLNCGRGSEDDRGHVEENRRRVAVAMAVASSHLIGPRQVHSARAAIATRVWEPADAPEADAVVTNVRGIAVSVLTADCAPVLLADPVAGVVAAAHAGWKGAKAGIIENTLKAMESLGASLHRIAAAIGPAISVSAYEVGPEFKAAFLESDTANGAYFTVPGSSGRPHFNLPAYVKDRLRRSGVDTIEDLDTCTYKNESILFSHRRSVHRSEPDYGRQISAIVIA